MVQAAYYKLYVYYFIFSIKLGAGVIITAL